MIKQWYKIVDRFMSSVWLYEKVFGKLLDPIVQDNRREAAKNILKNIYHYDDIDKIFPISIDKEEVAKQSKILFQAPIIDENARN